MSFMEIFHNFLGKKFFSYFLVFALLLSEPAFIFAQTLDTTAPADTTLTTEPQPAPDTTQIDETAHLPADATGPAFISIATASPEETKVNVVWTTDEPAYGFVEYGMGTGYGSSTPKSSSAALDHTVFIADLIPGTEYHYRIVAEDQSGNINYSEDRIFETAVELVPIDTAPPEISQVSVTNVTISKGTISWATNELAQGRVEYGKTAEYGLSSTLTGEYATEHSIELVELNPDTEYHYRIIVRDESGNEACTPDEVFTTDPLPVEESTSTPEEFTASTSEAVEEPSDEAATSTSNTTTETEVTGTSTPLAILHVETTSVGTSTATIIWNTNEAADAQVFYGPGETYASSSPVSAAKTTAHEIKLDQLKPGTNYFYRVVSKSISGETATESGFEFNTLFRQKKSSCSQKSRT